MAVDDHLTCGTHPLEITLLGDDNDSRQDMSVGETLRPSFFTDRVMMWLDLGGRIDGLSPHLSCNRIRAILNKYSIDSSAGIAGKDSVWIWNLARDCEPPYPPQTLQEP